MIVRIMGEGQYRLAGDIEQLNELDNAAVAAVEAGDEAGFLKSFAALLDEVRTRGALLGEDELEASDILFPPADTTFAEAQREGQFTGDGLIPD
jgi:hypothetical protein